MLLFEMYLEWIESIPSEMVQWIKRHADVKVQCIFEAHHIVRRVIMSLKFNPSVKRVNWPSTDQRHLYLGLIAREAPFTMRI